MHYYRRDIFLGATIYTSIKTNAYREGTDMKISIVVTRLIFENKIAKEFCITHRSQASMSYGQIGWILNEDTSVEESYYKPHENISEQEKEKIKEHYEIFMKSEKIQFLFTNMNALMALDGEEINIQVVRVNTEGGDLHVEFTIENYPEIIFQYMNFLNQGDKLTIFDLHYGGEVMGRMKLENFRLDIVNKMLNHPKVRLHQLFA